MQPDAKGTVISNKTVVKEIKAVAAKDDITAVKIKSSRMLMAYGFLRKIFEIFEKYRTPIDMVTTSEIAVSVTIDNENPDCMPRIQHSVPPTQMNSVVQHSKYSW